MNCKQCNQELTLDNTGEMWGNPHICWDCAVERADAKGCAHEYERCTCAADPTLFDEEKLTDFLRRNLAVVVDVEEDDTYGGYNNKRYLTISLTLHGEVITSDNATIYLNT
jgi:hypothetical protein